MSGQALIHPSDSLSLHLLRALESNQYNHITATYFLLAERMLRERQEREQHQTRSPSPSKTQFRYRLAVRLTDPCRDAC